MKKKLFDTYPSTLVEASPRDRLWGIGLGASNPKAKNPATWRGKNLLGYCLTEVRDKLMKQEGLIPDKVVNPDSLTEQGSNPKKVSKQQGSNPEKVEKQQGSSPEKGAKQQGSSPEKGAKQQGSSPEKGAKQQGSSPEKGLKKS